MLRAKIPKLLDHPALLAHTIYQTIVFDDAVRAGGFSLQRTSLYDSADDKADDWEGLAGVILREENWFKQWLAGEKKCKLASSIPPTTASEHCSRRRPATRDHFGE